MKLTTVVASVNNNPEYYLFIPKQIAFWKKMNVNFVAIFVGDKIPDELKNCIDNIILWDKNRDLHSAYVAQNIRIYIPALFNLPPDEMCMITDMDMLPANDKYYKQGLECYNKDAFIYYRNIDFENKQIYMCYNAAHPSTWAKVFNIYSAADIETRITENYQTSYNGRPGDSGWFIDQEIMFRHLINYSDLFVLNRELLRLEVYQYQYNIENGIDNFISNYDDIHFHRSYSNNEKLILDAERQIGSYM
jgi:hypothetical protein